LPDARLLRLDSDSLGRKGTWEDARQRILARQVDILVGTQLLVKGHDFPGLSLVIALNADQALFSSDFRATERLFAQLIQVAGRAGRGEIPGEVWIETEYADHPLYLALMNQDSEGFLQQELEQRQLVGWPPYSYLALLRVEAEKSEVITDFLSRAHQQAMQFAAAGEVQVYDPVPALMARRAGLQRWQLLVQSHRRGKLQGFLTLWHSALMNLRHPRELHWILEVDPLDC
ncbi:MAG: primosomal protein N', partial [Ferrovum sp.]|nr:primosomal protein N' [Ferrovum sp.]